MKDITAVIRLFKSVPVTKLMGTKKAGKDLLKETIKRGFVFAPEVISNYSEKQLMDMIKVVESAHGLTPDKMNASFHKSWNKVKTASMEQLIAEQITHYFTTYGLEMFGLANESLLYIPKEELNIPDLKENIPLVVIKGITKEELKTKVIQMLTSGVALKEETQTDIMDILKIVTLDEKEVLMVKNKEMRARLFETLNIVPGNPMEFLRYAIYLSTKKTLIIKNKVTIATIKADEENQLRVINAFAEYKKMHGLERLAEIFHRTKPLFLAFKSITELKPVINKIRKLADTHHKPMPKDYLNDLTDIISNGVVDTDKLNNALKGANTFRKIRLAYALKYRTIVDATTILYKIRNGKSYSSSKVNATNVPLIDKMEKALKVVLQSIATDISKNVKGKKVYLPENIIYALPATEKQFTGNLPSGTCVVVPKDMVFGVHWFNLVREKGDKNTDYYYETANEHRIDLDLSLLNTGGKVGWDSRFRTENGEILFSGDNTTAPLPNGASELFYISKQKDGSHLMQVNYYNHIDKPCPFTIVVAQEVARNLNKEYTINPNNVKCIAKTSITEKQKVLGVIITTAKECRFYFAETHLGDSISSRGGKFEQDARQYLTTFYSNSISFNDMLKDAGAKIVKDVTKADIDLSYEKLEKDTILKLLYKN